MRCPRPHHRRFGSSSAGQPGTAVCQPGAADPRLYVLAQAEPDAGIEITEVTGFRKFEELLPNYLFSFRFLQAQRLRWLAQLADQSLVYRVSRPGAWAACMKPMGPSVLI